MSEIGPEADISQHDNIDANDPTETWGVAVRYLAGMPRSVNIHTGPRVIGKIR
jgi:hypothetical protein